MNKVLEICNKKIEIFYEKMEKQKIPVVVLNTFEHEGEDVWKECKKIMTKDFILVAISNLNWNDEMTPWKCSPIYKGDSECKGEADNYLTDLENIILLKVEDYIKNELEKEIEFWTIAGYSLGGLFAMYAGYKTDVFKRIVSASGSMWYPKLVEFVMNNKLNGNVDKVYFSLGDKEANTKNEILKTVQKNTEAIYNKLKNEVETIFELNNGNHFQEANLRTAKGIKWILEGE